MMEDKQSSPSNQDQPTETQIAEMLESFQPVPSARFYHRLAAAPWMGDAHKFKRIFGGLSGFIQNKSLRIATAVTLVFIIVLGGFLIFPTLQVIASQIFHYFIPEQSDQIVVPISIAQDGSILSYDDPDFFSLSHSAAQEQVDFELKQIPTETFQLDFSGAHFNPVLGAITSHYQGDAFTLYLTQRPPGGIKEYSSVGATAPVKLVQVNGHEAEFVVGGWRLSPDATLTSEPNQPIQAGELDIYWDASLPQQALRWQADNQVYEILAFGDKNMDEEKLIRIAENLQ